MNSLRRFRDKKLYAINGKTGAKYGNLKQEGRHRYNPPLPSVGWHGVYPRVKTDNKKLYALNGKTGRQKWNLKQETTSSPPSCSDGTVYVGSRWDNQQALCHQWQDYGTKGMAV